MPSDQGVVATGEHDGRVILNEGKSMTVEVSEHGIASPSAKDADAIGVYAAKEKSYGATGAKGVGSNVLRVNTTVTRDTEDNCMK